MKTNNQINKVLISGASGFLGTLSREIFYDKQLTLISRTIKDLKKNEVWIKGENLTNFEWWSAYVFEQDYDLVMHFAEPVKSYLDPVSVDRVIKSHLNFLSNASKIEAYVIYPLTAYCYDNFLSKKQITYLQIKNEVSSVFRDDINILLPIFHPLVDFGDGLKKLIYLEKKIPLVNLFCSFHAKILILKRRDLELFFLNLDYRNSGILDIYSKKIEVSQLFQSRKRIDLKLISIPFKFLCFLVSFLPQARLLLSGRKTTKK